jgi:hypothetical protein
MAMTDKPEGKGTRTTLTVNALLGVSIGLIGISSLSAVAFLAGNFVPLDRAASFALGFCSAIIGTGLSTWCALRIRRLALIEVAICSLVPFAFWSWIFFGIATDRIVIS